MHPNEFEAKMREFETYHALRVTPDCYPIVRVDGRGFSKTTKALGFKKPFDRPFHDHMIATAQALLVSTGALYAYTESDEISIVLPKATKEFNREIEKIVSTTASTATAVFNLDIGMKRQDWFASGFDSRVITAPNLQVVTDYFAWRQADAARCCLNGYAHWLQVNEGVSATKVAKSLEGAGVDQKMDVLFARGINFADLPGWQRNGTGLYHESYLKEATNPISGVKVQVVRRRVEVNEGLPIRDEYRTFIANIINRSENAT